MTSPASASSPGDDLVERLIRTWPDLAGDRSRVRVARAPGRVNLIGEHTDYNDGLVLPAAISLAIEVAFVPTHDHRVELVLASNGDRGSLDLDDLGPRRGAWLDYVAGTAWALHAAGVRTTGFRGILASAIPSGAGLSSSAAIELATAWALSGGTAPALEPLALARTAQRAENEYVGVMCGLMDQFAVTMGRAGQALHLDCRSLAWHPVPIPSDLELVVCHSGSPRRLEASAYNARRAECGRAAAAIAAREPGVSSLRDVDAKMLERHRDRLDPVAYARALHVVTENDRVVEVETALRAGDAEVLGRLFAASHASLRDRFEVSSDALDALVDIAVATPGVVAARLTGAGFGGCTINLVERGRASELRTAVERQYRRRTGLTPRVFVVEAADGAGLVSGHGPD
ncbi:MAG TPA: galactokinase [Candidatus Sulfomarinibacteraceae bacterium]|nr:galactokinase [Candidatus Sulfomarinibacteraceae bacterium]